MLLSISPPQPITLVDDYNTVLPRSIYSNIFNFLSTIFLIIFLIRFRINLLKQHREDVLRLHQCIFANASGSYLLVRMSYDPREKLQLLQQWLA